MKQWIVFLIAVFIFAYGQVSIAADAGKGLFIKYEPPKSGKPGARVGGSARGACIDAVMLEALVPDHIGFTSQLQPTLCWHASKPIATRLEITVNEDDSAATLLDKQIAAPEKNGIQCMRLRDHGLTLKPGVEYQWFVAVAPDSDQKSKDIGSGGVISYTEASKDLQKRLNSTSGLEIAAVYAEAGFWYDAIGILAEMLQAHPDDKNLIEQMNSLLWQVDLQEF